MKTIKSTAAFLKGSNIYKEPITYLVVRVSTYSLVVNRNQKGVLQIMFKKTEFFQIVLFMIKMAWVYHSRQLFSITCLESLQKRET